MDSESASLLFSQVLRTDASSELVERIGKLSEQIDSCMGEYSVQSVALERVFAQANLRSVMGVAQISGAVMASAHRRGLPVEFFTPTEVKLSVCGNGRASKAEVMATIERFYPKSLKTSHPDEADAVAIALCASRRGTSNQTAAQRAWSLAAKAAKGKLG